MNRKAKLEMILAYTLSGSTSYGACDIVTRNEIDRLIIKIDKVYKMNQNEMEIFKKLTSNLKESLEDAGGCDHSVGICYCQDIQLIEDANNILDLRETIKKATG